MYHERTTLAARGKWRGILREFGIPETVLRNKHGECPLCQSDNFRFDDKEGSGSWICTCASGKGVDLAMAFSGMAFRDACNAIDGMLGNIKVEASPQRVDPDKTRDILRETWLSTKPVETGDLVHKYLATRGVEELIYPPALRFSPNMRDGDGGVRPCMVAMIGVHGEAKFASMHRTFLRADGSGKADMDAPRKIMPGELPDGACVMLSDYAGGPLGIAEGIETAMSASAIYDMPVWSALNATLMKKWTPPEGCDEVAVFGDNDLKFGGQAAAYHLAHRLACKGIHVTVRIPDMPGTDWNDVHMRRRR